MSRVFLLSQHLFKYFIVSSFVGGKWCLFEGFIYISHVGSRPVVSLLLRTVQIFCPIGLLILFFTLYISCFIQGKIGPLLLIWWIASSCLFLFSACFLFCRLPCALLTLDHVKHFLGSFICQFGLSLLLSFMSEVKKAFPTLKL